MSADDLPPDATPRQVQAWCDRRSRVHDVTVPAVVLARLARIAIAAVEVVEALGSLEDLDDDERAALALLTESADQGVTR